MDRERLGRVLGRGAREAVRTALEAVHAATAPAPDKPVPQVASSQIELHPTPATKRTQSALSRRTQPVLSKSMISSAATAAGAGVLVPLRRAFRELWHEFTGSFFALFALSFGVGTWHTRACAFSSVAGDRHRFYIFCGLTFLFAYFSMSSFMRARRQKA